MPSGYNETSTPMRWAHVVAHLSDERKLSRRSWGAGIYIEYAPSGGEVFRFDSFGRGKVYTPTAGDLISSDWYVCVSEEE